MAQLKIGTTIGGFIDIHAGNYIQYSPSLTGSGATGNWNINILGNSATSNKWSTPRTLRLIGSVSGCTTPFDGSGNITMSTIVANDSHTHNTQYYTKSYIDALFTGITPDQIYFTTGTGVDSTIRYDVGNLANGACSSSLSGSLNTSNNLFSFIGGGENNQNFGNYSTLVGGDRNYVCGTNGFIGGGLLNKSYCNNSVIVGGRNNTNSGINSFIGGGNDNFVTNTLGISIGGSNNCSNGVASSIFNGILNRSVGDCSSVLNGYCNLSDGIGSTILNGCINNSKGYFSLVLNGRNNKSCGNFSSVDNGCNNTTNGCFNVIENGIGNITNCNYSTIINGNTNLITGEYSSILNGKNNIVSNCNSIILGGENNSTSGSFNNINGGRCNKNTGKYSSINGGYYNIIINSNENTSKGVTIGGGIGHNTGGGDVDPTTGEITGLIICYNTNEYTTIAGGFRNVTIGSHSTVGGGCLNYANGQYSTVSGGRYNNACAENSTVSGGRFNTANDYASFVGGGYHNAANCFSSTVGGGYCSYANGYISSVLGGRDNLASGCYSTVGAGYNNKSNGDYSAIVGGKDNISNNVYSGIFGGTNNNINHDCSFAIGVNLTSDAICTTYMNNVKVGGTIRATYFCGDGSGLTGLTGDNYYTTGVTFTGGSLITGRNNLTPITTCLDGRYPVYPPTDGCSYVMNNETWVVVSTGVTGNNNYTTSMTFDNSTGNLDITRCGLSGLTTNLDGRYLPLSGGVINGNLTITGNTTGIFYGDGSNLTGVNSSYVTGATFNIGTGDLTLRRYNSTDIVENLDGRYSYDGHDHDERYYTQSQTDAKYLNISGGTINGNLTITGNTTGSTFYGAFVGDGSGLTGFTANNNYTTGVTFFNGILSTERYNLTPITTNLDGRYSMTGHSHNDLYYTKTETDNKYSLTGHTHPNYSETGHTHDDRYYTETESDNRFSLTGHTHSIYLTDAPIDGNSYVRNNALWVLAPTGSTGTGTTANNYTTSLSFNASDGILSLGRCGLSTLTTSLDSRYSLTGHTHSNYSETGHTHDDRYYTETEIDNILLGYSETGHTHSIYLSDVPNDGNSYVRKYNEWIVASSGTTGSNNYTTNVTFSGGTLYTSRNNLSTIETNLDGRYLNLTGGTINGTVTGAFIGDGSGLTGLTNNLDTRYSLTGHTHDDLYYRKTESDGKYTLIGHTHDDRYYTETESDNRFSLTGHTHDILFIRGSGTNSTLRCEGNNIVSGNYSTVLGGCNNEVTSNCAGILGGMNNTVTHENSFIIGANLTTDAVCTTYMNNLKVQGNIYGGNFFGNGAGITGLTGYTSEAPVDGNIYGRKNGDWEIINLTITGGTGTTISNNYTTGVTFNTSNGILTTARYGLSNLTTNLDGRYSLTGHTHNYIEEAPIDNLNYTRKNGAWESINLNISGGTSLYILGTGSNSTMRCGVGNLADGTNSSSLSGLNNKVCGVTSNYSSILGGCNNTITGETSFIGGGYCNNIYNINSSILGGNNNKIYSQNSTLLGGNNNNICLNASSSIIGGGVSNVITDGRSGILSGQSNCAKATCSIVGGGCGNWVDGTLSAILGGKENKTYGINNFIGGGRGNTTCGSYSTVSGGLNNSATGINSSILGGSANIASGNYSTVNGGNNNTASGISSVVVGGELNKTLLTHGFIGGGKNNEICGIYGSYGSISGGELNKITGEYSAINGGCGNIIDSCYSFLGGGKNNSVRNCFSITVGGQNNTNRGVHSIIGGGFNNQVCSNITCGGVLGGYNNTLNHNNSFIVGSNLTSDAVCTTYVNNLNISGSTKVQCNIISGGGITGSTICSTGELITEGGITSYGDIYSNGGKFYGDGSGLTGITGTGGGLYIVGTGSDSTKRCGVSNDSIGNYSAALSGINNLASGHYSFVGGGQSNGNLNVVGCLNDYSFIGGGLQNKVVGVSTSIGGGINNTINGNYSTISGGIENHIGVFNNWTECAQYSGILGGYNNKVYHDNSFIVGSNLETDADLTTYVNNLNISGNTKVQHDIRSGGDIIGINICAVGGKLYGDGSELTGISIPEGIYVVGTGTNSTIRCGSSNTTNSTYSSILGGSCNEIKNCAGDSNYSSILGGANNEICNSTNSLIGVPDNSDIINGDYSVLLNGDSNDIMGTLSFIGTGGGSTIDGAYSFIGVGVNGTVQGHPNKATIITGEASFIGVGVGNSITADNSGILGGKTNTISHNDSFIIGSNLTSDAVCTTYVNNLTVDVNAKIKGNLNSIGGITGSTIYSTGTIRAIGNISGSTVNATNFVGNGSSLTNVCGCNVTGATFCNTNGYITINSKGGLSTSVTIDGRYSLLSHTHPYSPLGHTHDDRYYTESESDAKYFFSENIQTMTQVEYEALTPDPNTYYYTTIESEDYYVTGSEIETTLGGYSTTGHTHDDLYYGKTESDNRFLNITGGTINGNLDITGDVTANNLGTISSKDFWSGSQVDYDAIVTKDPNTIYFIV